MGVSPEVKIPSPSSTADTSPSEDQSPTKYPSPSEETSPTEESKEKTIEEIEKEIEDFKNFTDKCSIVKKPVKHLQEGYQYLKDEYDNI